MGLFDKIGKKNNCDFCGDKIGLLDKKLADGFMCKACAKKLSPYFDGIKTSTVDSIGAQLADREANKERLLQLTPSHIYGDAGVILIDQEHRQFAVIDSTSEGLFKSNKAVTCVDDVADLNPDVIRFDQVKEAKLDLVETSREEKHTVDGKQVSYNPKHMTYMCSFTMRIQLKDHPYLDHVYVPLSGGNVNIYTEEPRRTSSLGAKVASRFLDMPGLDLEKMESYTTSDSVMKFFFGNANGLPDYSYGYRVSTRNKNDICRYSGYLVMANTIKAVLEGKR